MEEASDKPISSSDFEQLGLDPEALIDFDLLVDGVFKILKKQLGFTLPSIGMYHEDQKGIRLVKLDVPEGIRKIIKKMTGKELEEHVFYISDKENLMVRSFLEQEIIVVDSVVDLGYPFIARSVGKLVDKFSHITMAVVTPLIAQGKSVGVFAFATSGKTNLSNVEKDFLSNLCNQIATYLKTSWLLKRAVEDKELAVTHNKDLEKLLKLKQEFLLDVSTLLSGLTSEFGLQEEKREDIKDTLKYLKSLFLLSESVANTYGQEKTYRDPGEVE